MHFYLLFQCTKLPCNLPYQKQKSPSPILTNCKLPMTIIEGKVFSVAVERCVSARNQRAIWDLDIYKERRYRRAFVVSVTVEALIKVSQSIARGERDESNQQSPTQSAIVEAKLRPADGYGSVHRNRAIEGSSIHKSGPPETFHRKQILPRLRIFQIHVSFALVLNLNRISSHPRYAVLYWSRMKLGSLEHCSLVVVCFVTFSDVSFSPRVG